MSQSVVVNGTTFTIPDVDDENWGQNVTDYLVALSVVAGLTQSFMNIVTVTTTPVSVALGRTYLVDTSVARTLQLPAASSNFFFIVRDKTGGADTNAITVARAAGEQIDGVAASKILNTRYGWWLFACDGTNWFTINLGTVNPAVADFQALAAAPALKAGRIYFNTTDQQFYCCKDGSNWSILG